MTDCKCNFEMTTQSQSSILRNLSPAESVTTDKFPESSNDLSKNRTFKIQASSTEDLDDCVEFSRRFGKTYSPYGNLGPTVRKFGKTYSPRGNLKNTNAESSYKSDSEKYVITHSKPISVENVTSPINVKSYTLVNVSLKKELSYSNKVTTKDSSKFGKPDVLDLPAQNKKIPCPKTLSQGNIENNVKHIIAPTKSVSVENANSTINVKSHNLKNTSGENDLPYSKKAIIKDSSMLEGHFEKHNYLDIGTEKIKLPDDKSKVILLKTAVSGGQPAVTFHLMPSSNASTTSPVGHMSGNEGPSATGEKTPLKYQLVLVDKNSVGDSKTLVDQITSAPPFGIVNKSHASQIKNTLPVSANRKDALSDAKGLEQFDHQLQINTFNPSKNILPFSVSSEAIQMGRVSCSDIQFSQNNVLVVPQSTDDTSNNETKGNSLLAQKMSIPDISVNKRRPKKKLKSLKKLSKVSSFDSKPYKVRKKLSKTAKEILTNSDSACWFSVSENSTKSGISDDLKSTSKVANCTSRPLKKKVIDSAFEEDVKKKKRKSNKKTKLKPVPTELATSVDLLNSQSLVDANKNGKKCVKEKTKMLSKKEKLLKSKKKKKLPKSEKHIKDSSKKKAKFSNQFNDDAKIGDKILKSPFLPKLEKVVPIVLKEQQSAIEISVDAMPVLEDATKKTPHGCDIKKMVPTSMLSAAVKVNSKSTNTEIFISDIGQKKKKKIKSSEWSTGIKKDKKSHGSDIKTMVPTSMLSAAVKVNSKSTTTEIFISDTGQKKMIKSSAWSTERKKDKKSVSTKHKTKNLKSSKVSTDMVVKTPKLSKVQINCHKAKSSMDTNVEKPKPSKSSSDTKTKKRKLSELSDDAKKNKLSTDIKKKRFKSSRLDATLSVTPNSAIKDSDYQPKSSRIGAKEKRSKLSSETSKLSPDTNVEMPKLSELSFVTDTDLCKVSNLSSDTNVEMPKLSKLLPVTEIKEKLESRKVSPKRKTSSLKPLNESTESDEKIAPAVKGEHLADLSSSDAENKQRECPALFLALELMKKFEKPTDSETPEQKATEAKSEISGSNVVLSSTPIYSETEPIPESSLVDTPKTKKVKCSPSSPQIDIEKPSLPLVCAASSAVTESATSNSTITDAQCQHKNNLALSTTPILSKTKPLSESAFVDTPSTKTTKNGTSYQQICIQKPFSLVGVSSTTISATSKSSVKDSDCQHKKDLALSSTPITPKTEQIVDTPSTKTTKNSTSSQQIDIQKPFSLVGVSTATSKSAVKDSDCRHKKDLALSSTPITPKTEPLPESCFVDTPSTKTIKNSTSSQQIDIQKPFSLVGVSTATSKSAVKDSDCRHKKDLALSSTPITPKTEQIVDTPSTKTTKNSTSSQQIDIQKPFSLVGVSTATSKSAVKDSDCQHKKDLALSSTPITPKTEQIVDTPSTKTTKNSTSSQQIDIQKPFSLVGVSTATSKSAVKDSDCQHKKDLALSSTPITPKTEQIVDTPSTKTTKNSTSSQQIDIQKPFSLVGVSTATSKSAVKDSDCRHKKDLALSSTPITPKTEPLPESCFVDTPSTKTIKNSTSSQQIDIQKPFSLVGVSTATSKSAVKDSDCRHKKDLALSSTPITPKTEQIVDTPSTKTTKNSTSSQQIDIQKPFSLVGVSTATSKSAVKDSDCQHKKDLALSSTPITPKTEQILESSFVDTLSMKTTKNSLLPSQINIQKPSLSLVSVTPTTSSATANSVFDQLVIPDALVSESSKKLKEHNKLSSPASTPSIPTSLPNFYSQTLLNNSGKGVLAQPNILPLQINIQKPSLPFVCSSVTPNFAVKDSDCQPKKNLAFSWAPISLKTEPLPESCFVDTPSTKTAKNSKSSQQIDIQKPFSLVGVFTATSISAVKDSDCRHKKDLALSSTPITPKTEQILESSFVNTLSMKTTKNSLLPSQINIQKPSLSLVSVTPTTSSATANSVFYDLVKPDALVSESSKKLKEHNKLSSPASTPSIPTSLPNFHSQTLLNNSGKGVLAQPNILPLQINIQKPSLPSVCSSCSSATPVISNFAVKDSDCQPKKNLTFSSAPISVKTEPLLESSFVDTPSTKTTKNSTSSLQIDIQKPFSLVGVSTATSKSAVKDSDCRHKKDLALSSTPITPKTEPLLESSFVDTPSTKTTKNSTSSLQIDIQKPFSLVGVSTATSKSAVKDSDCRHKKDLALSLTPITPKTEQILVSSIIHTPSTKTAKNSMSSPKIDNQKPLFQIFISSTTSAAAKFVFDHLVKSGALVSESSKKLKEDNKLSSPASTPSIPTSLPNSGKDVLARSIILPPQINIQKPLPFVCSSVTPNFAVNDSFCQPQKNLAFSSASISSESSFVDTPSMKTAKNSKSSPQNDIQKPLFQMCVSSTTSAAANIVFDHLVKLGTVVSSSSEKLKEHNKLSSPASTPSIPTSLPNIQSQTLLNNSGKGPPAQPNVLLPQINIPKPSLPLVCTVTPNSVVKDSDCQHEIKYVASKNISASSIGSHCKISSSNKNDDMPSTDKILLVKTDTLISRSSKKSGESGKLLAPTNVESTPISLLNNSGKTPQPLFDRSIRVFPLSANKTDVGHLGLTNATNTNPVCLKPLKNSTVTLPTTNDIKTGDRFSVEPCLAEHMTKRPSFLPKRENLGDYKMVNYDTLKLTLSVDEATCEGIELSSKSSMKKQESTILSSEDHKASTGNCKFISSVSSTPAMEPLTNDSATPCKSPSVSFSAVSLPVVAMPSSAEMGDNSSSSCLSASEQKHKSKSRRLCKKPPPKKNPYLTYKRRRSSRRQKIKTLVHMLCNVCHDPFTHRHKLGVHIRSNWGRELYNCGFCGRNFLNNACFLVHRRTHKGKNVCHKNAAKVGNNQTANTVASTCSNNGQDPVSTSPPKSSEDNKNSTKVTPPMTECESTGLLKKQSLMMTPENAHHAKVRKSLKANQSVSHGFKYFQVLDSSKSLKGVSDANSSKKDFVKTQPATESISSGQELVVSDLSPPMLSPQNILPTSATHGDESLGLEMEHPPFLSKVPNPNFHYLKNFESNLFKLQTDSTVSNLIKEEPSDSAPSLCPEISTAPSAVDSANVKKDILVKDVKESENLEKNDHLTSDTFHEQERVIFLSNNDGPNVSAHSQSMNLVDWPKTMVQCSVEEQHDNNSLSKESSRNGSETLLAKDQESKETCRKTLFEEIRTKETAKTSVTEKNSGISKCRNSLESLPQPPSLAKDDQCSDSKKDQSTKSNLVPETPKQESELFLKPIRCIPKRNYKKPRKYFCVDFDTSGWTGGTTCNPKAPVVTSTNTLSVTNSSPAKSQSVNSELSENLTNKTKEDFSQKNKTKCDNNKVNDNINTTTKNNDIDMKNNSNTNATNHMVNDNVNTIDIKNNDIDMKNNSNTNATNHMVNDNVNTIDIKNNDIDMKNNSNTNATNHMVNDNVNTIDTKNNSNTNNTKVNNNKVNDNVTTTTTTTTKSNYIANNNIINTNDNEPGKSEMILRRSKRQYDIKNKKLKEEMTKEVSKMNDERERKTFLRLRFKDFKPQLYYNNESPKDVTSPEQTDSPQIAALEDCRESPDSLSTLLHDQRPLLPVVKMEWDVPDVPPKKWREELLDNLISYSSTNSDTIEKVSGHSCQIKSEECNLPTEPIQLSKLLSSPQAVVSSPAAAAAAATTLTPSYTALPLPLIAPTTLCVTQSVPTIATFVPVTNTNTTNNMTIPLTILTNPMPVFTKLKDNQIFIGNLSTPLLTSLPMPVAQDQKPVFPQILPKLLEPKAVDENPTDFIPALKIKKEVVTNDHEYGGNQSDSAFGLRITGVAGNVTTHDAIPANSDAIYSNASTVGGHNTNQRPTNDQNQLVIRERNLQCKFIQTVDRFGVSEFSFECCGFSFSKNLELASHIDLCHK